MKKVYDEYAVVYKTDEGLKVFTYKTEDEANLSRKVIETDSQKNIEWLEVIPSKFMGLGKS
ncbi:hypothetical protein [Priestia megaterium]|uniref:hypothetical protein n=1 Tax=Priestia megaterium TaxID=1404 RepID=UPI0028780111|nr:hypothetical protein [Priestia megaterium]